MQDRKLLSVTQVTDDSTGCYTVGELDYGIHGDAYDYLANTPDGRAKLAAHLRGLADACAAGRDPFSPAVVDAAKRAPAAPAETAKGADPAPAAPDQPGRKGMTSEGLAERLLAAWRARRAKDPVLPKPAGWW